ncbi:MAG TPA: DinB family protein [Vicinamibacteria bacterium]|nr:DinB family protein [Vicinamibacteria bacterium]
MNVTPADALAVLERTPAALRGLLLGLPEAWLLADEGPETFSPRDVVGHLLHGEETDWLPRLRIILEHGEAVPFTPFDRFAFRTTCAGVPTAELLGRFEARRRANLDAVRGTALDGATLARTGRHPALGRVTLGQLLAAWVVHDLGHLKQVARAMARQYRDAVGPWREYLTILDRP